MAKVILGFKETKEVLDLVIALGTGIKASLQDEKISFEDLPNFFAVIFKIAPALEGVDQVPVEFKLANEEEVAELKAYLREQLDLEDDQMEEFIEDAFAVVLDLWHTVNKYFLNKQSVTLKPVAPSTDKGSVQSDEQPNTDA